MYQVGFRKGKKNKSDLKSKTAVLLEKSPETLTKEEKKLISARIAEIKKYNNDSAVVQNAIPYLTMFKDGMEMQDLFCVNLHVSPLDQIDALKFVKS